MNRTTTQQIKKKKKTTFEKKFIDIHPRKKKKDIFIGHEEERVLVTV
jgi:hypothetical protein